MIKFTHVAIHSSSFDDSIFFYKSWCDLDIINDRRIYGGNTVWLGYPTNNQIPNFVLVIYDISKTFLVNHLGFQVESLNKLKDYETKAFIKNILYKPVANNGKDVGYTMSVKDPGDNIVEFTYGQNLTGIN